jgi:hypothetical protein
MKRDDADNPESRMPMPPALPQRLAAVKKSDPRHLIEKNREARCCVIRHRNRIINTDSLWRGSL